MGPRLVDDAREHHGLARLELDRLRKRDHLAGSTSSAMHSKYESAPWSRATPCRRRRDAAIGRDVLLREPEARNHRCSWASCSSSVSGRVGRGLRNREIYCKSMLGRPTWSIGLVGSLRTGVVQSQAHAGVRRDDRCAFRAPCAKASKAYRSTTASLEAGACRTARAQELKDRSPRPPRS